MNTNEKREAIACMQRRKERLAHRAMFVQHTNPELADLYDEWWEAADKVQQEMLVELRAEEAAA